MPDVDRPAHAPVPGDGDGDANELAGMPLFVMPDGTRVSELDLDAGIAAVMAARTTVASPTVPQRCLDTAAHVLTVRLTDGMSMSDIPDVVSEQFFAALFASGLVVVHEDWLRNKVAGPATTFIDRAEASLRDLRAHLTEVANRGEDRT